MRGHPHAMRDCGAQLRVGQCGGHECLLETLLDDCYILYQQGSRSAVGLDRVSVSLASEMESNDLSRSTITHLQCTLTIA